MPETKLVPEPGLVLVKRIDDQTSVTKGGIHLPDNVWQKIEIGRCVAVGPTLPDEPSPQFRDGDTLIYPVHKAAPIRDRDDREVYGVLRQSEVLAHYVESR